MTRIKIISILSAIALLLVVAFFVSHKKSHAFVTIGTATYEVTLAETELEQGRGLGGRAQLASSEGMLFIFQNPDRYSFWMKDMLFPIDIIWADAEKNIIFMKENALPDDYPNTYVPDKQALYVLEISSGEIARNHFALGEKMYVAEAK